MRILFISVFTSVVERMAISMPLMRALILQKMKIEVKFQCLGGAGGLCEVKGHIASCRLPKEVVKIKLNGYKTPQTISRVKNRLLLVVFIAYLVVQSSIALISGNGFHETSTPEGLF